MSLIFDMSTWCLEGFSLSIDSHSSLIFLQSELNPMPPAIMKSLLGSFHFYCPTSQVQMNIKVSIQ